MSYDDLEQSPYGGAPVECFKFVMGLTEYRLTTADAAIVVAGESYAPAPIHRGEIDLSQEADGGSVEVTIDRLHPLSMLFMPYLPAEPVSVAILRLHRTEPETKTPFTGVVSQARYERSSCVLVCTGHQSALKRAVPKLHYQRQCNWALYSAQCGVNRESFKDTAVLSAISGATISSATFDARADGWYENGWAETTDGHRRMILAHAGDTLTLLAPFFGIAAGATVYAFAGCDRTLATCHAKFDNRENFFGFEDLPARNPHEKGVQ